MDKKTLQNSVWFRLCIIGLTTLALLIPSGMITSLIQERQNRYDDVFAEIAEKWGSNQTVSGPILSVPYTVEVEYEKGKVVKSTRYLHILPEDLKIDAKITPFVRYRGIYEIVVYSGEIELSGSIVPGDIDLIDLPNDALRWSEAFISFGVTDMKGIKNLVQLEWNGEVLQMDPGVESQDIIDSGISKKVGSVNKNGANPFKLTLNLNGSSGLFFTPLGKVTDVAMTSSWKEPSFTGGFLPEDRVINEQGFSAKWQVLHLNRSFPQKWTGNLHTIQESAFGVKLLVPVNEYQKNMRTAKYAFMLITLTFLSFFMIELLTDNMIHPIQYLLTGFALLVFYTLLLSLSEHLGFDFAYLIASVATISLIVVYLKSVLDNLVQTGIVGGILILLYGYMYMVLQLQDYALLVGSIGSFIILATVMYLTRKTNWSGGMHS